MDKKHSDLYAVEREYWWSAVRRGEVLRIAGNLDRDMASGLTLDAGSGGGALCVSLRGKGANCVALDASAQACSAAAVQGIPAVNAAAEKLPFKNSSFDRLFALDLLEHLFDDDLALSEMARVIKKGGWIFISLPAFKCLFGERDRYLGHCRRYTLGRVKKQLRRHGFTPVYSRYIFSALFIPLLAARRTLTAGEGKETYFNAGLLNNVLRIVFILETLIGRVLFLPFGTSLICAAQKCREKQ